jgi:hypothetical protein
MAAPAGMSTLAAASMAAGVGAGVLGAAGAYQQGQAAKAMGRNNQIMAEYAAQDALRRGDAEAAAVQRRASQVQGAQRAALAAKGLDINAGTAGELQDQTDFFSQVDQSTARTNAARDAWSARVQGANARAQGDAAARQGTTGAFATLLGTGAQVADKWATWSKPQGFQGYGGRY